MYNLPLLSAQACGPGCNSNGCDGLVAPRSNTFLPDLLFISETPFHFFFLFPFSGLPSFIYCFLGCYFFRGLGVRGWGGGRGLDVGVGLGCF